jgi:hypothetical protein
VVERIDAIPADRHAVGRVVGQARQRMHEGRPGQRSEAAGGQARQHEASAQARARMRRVPVPERRGSVMAAPSRPARRRAARRCIRAAAGAQRAGWRACASTRARRRGAMPSASMASMRSSTARTLLAFGVQQQARARLHAGDALRRVQRRASLHHHELPADRAVVVGLPADAAEHAPAGTPRSAASGRAGACAPVRRSAGRA